MENNNINKFLDESGVLTLWNKINEYFSQIGHHHETSDVNGLDDYMEENSKAIKLVEWKIEDVKELPEYPSKGDKDKVVRFENELYRAVEISEVTIDFSEIKGSTARIYSDEIAELLNKNGHVISGEFIICDNVLHFYEGGIKINEYLSFQQENNENNKIYFKKCNIIGHAYFDDLTNESENSRIQINANDLHGTGVSVAIDYKKASRKGDVPNLKTDEINFLDYYLCKPVDFVDINSGKVSKYAAIIKKISFEVISADSKEDYDNGMFYNTLVWKKIDESELDVDTSEQKASSETLKRFYRTPDNTVNVTDKTKDELQGINVEFRSGSTKNLSENEILTILNNGHLWVNKINKYKSIYGGKVNGGIYDGIEIGYRRNTSGILCFTASDKFVLSICPYFYFNGSEYGTSVGDTNFSIDGTTYTLLHFTTIEELPAKTMTFELTAGYHEIATYVPSVEQKDGKEEKKLKKVAKSAVLDGAAITFAQAATKDTKEGNLEAGSCIRLTMAKVGDVFPAEFAWNQVVKKSDLVPVARTNDYNDLDNKPTVGDILIHDYDNNKNLPELALTYEYEKTILRLNNELIMAIYHDPGYDMNMSHFSTWAKENYTTYSWEKNANAIFLNYMFNLNMGIASDYYKSYFCTSYKMNVRHTYDIGLLIGTAGSGEEGYGYVLIDLRPVNESKDDAYFFNSVTVTLLSYNISGGDESREVKDYCTYEGNAYIELGTSVVEAPSSTEITHELNPLASAHYHFESGIPIETKTFTLYGEDCNYLKIYTATDEKTETYGYRVIVKDILFNDLRCYAPLSTRYTRELKEKRNWKQITNTGIEVIDLT